MPNNLSSPAIQIDNLFVRFKGKAVLEDISFTLAQGEFLGLIGPNGGGKTVLLKTIVGLISPDSGRISVLSKTPKKARADIGFVPQFANFETDFPITVMEVVLMGRLGHGTLFYSYSANDRLICEQVLEKVQMLDYAQAQISKLSGGQVQRVLIARALAVQPKLLLLDEPTASLDTQIGRNFYDLMRVLSNELTIVLATHDIGVIAEYVQSIACLNRTLHYHHGRELSSAVIAEVYGCSVELLAHGHAHRVLETHDTNPCSTDDKN